MKPCSTMKRTEFAGTIHDVELVDARQDDQQRRLVLYRSAARYWINWISSFSQITEPGVVARLRPISKAGRRSWRCARCHTAVKFLIP